MNAPTGFTMLPDGTVTDVDPIGGDLQRRPVAAVPPHVGRGLRRHRVPGRRASTRSACCAAAATGRTGSASPCRSRSPPSPRSASRSSATSPATGCTTGSRRSWRRWSSRPRPRTTRRSCSAACSSTARCAAASRSRGSASLLAGNSFDTVIAGLDDIPDDERPPVNVVHLAFQTMVARRHRDGRHRRVVAVAAGAVTATDRARLDRGSCGRPSPAAGWPCSRSRRAGPPPRSAGSRGSSTGVMRVEDAVTTNSGIWISLVAHGDHLRQHGRDRRAGCCSAWRAAGATTPTATCPRRTAPAASWSRRAPAVRREASVNLADLAAALMFLGVVAYAILGGADFGSGVWDLLAGDARQGAHLRSQIDRSIGPVWEANHVWLIYVLVFLWTAFPTAFGAIMTTLFVPWLLVGLGIVLRGGAFAFRKFSHSVARGAAARRGVRGVVGGHAVLPRHDRRARSPAGVCPPRAPATSGRRGPGRRRGSAGVLAVLTVSFLAATFLAADAAPGRTHRARRGDGRAGAVVGRRRRCGRARRRGRDRARRRDAGRRAALARPRARGRFGRRPAWRRSCC